MRTFQRGLKRGGRAGGLTAEEWEDAWRENENKYGLDVEKWPQEAQAALLKRWNVLDADKYKRYNTFYLTNYLYRLRNLPRSHPDTWLQDLQTLSVTELSNRVQRWSIEEAQRKRRFERERLKQLVFQTIAEGSYTHILGPVSFTEHYSPTMDKQVLVFGDFHTYRQRCDDKKPSDVHIEFLDLVEYLVTHGPKEKQTHESSTKVDVFLETPYLVVPGTKDDQRIGMLGQLARRFPGCFLMSKDGCAYSSFARFHYVDVRFRSESHVGQMLPGYFDKWDTPFNNVRSKLAAAKHVAKSLNQTDTATSELAALKIPKQYENIYPLSLRVKLQSWFTEKIKQLGDELLALDFETYYSVISKLVNEGEEKKAHMYLDNHGIGKNIADVLFTIDPKRLQISGGFDDPVERLLNWTADRTATYHAMFMDYYTIGRLFRSYPDGAQVAKRSIIFVGEQHADNYRRIFDVLGFQRIGKPAVDSATSFQCIPINRPIRWIPVEPTAKHPKPDIEHETPSKRTKRSATDVPTPTLIQPSFHMALRPRNILPPPIPPTLRAASFHMTLRPNKPWPTPLTLPPPPYVSARPTTAFAASDNL